MKHSLYFAKLVLLILCENDHRIGVTMVNSILKACLVLKGIISELQQRFFRICSLEVSQLEFPVVFRVDAHKT